MQVRPTAEQLRALEYFLSGEATAIEAGAGTGKTTTLALCAGATTDQVQYVAFNRSIVQDSRGKLPPNARAHTAHGLAMRAVGHAYEHRLHSSGRMRSSEIAQRLGIEPYVVQLGPGGERKRVSASKLAGYCMAGVTNYCQSADVEPTARHVPYIKGIDLVVDGRPTYTNNDQVATYLEQHMRAAWCDLVNPTGELPYQHQHYLKLWQLGGTDAPGASSYAPHIPADIVLFDEAQDASPVMIDIMAKQQHAQLVWVGDSQQRADMPVGCLVRMLVPGSIGVGKLLEEL